MDVAAAVDVTIMTTNPLKIPTGLIGPIIINGQPAAATTVTGVGGMTLASRTLTLTVVIDGKYAQASFSITPLPPTVQCLIGRDVLAQLGIVLTNDHPLG
ncbi:hypothetical protein DUI87_19414 [Hirundo rustica rustica]|uniref:Retropepsins domain-containing protein n=1 Tax=Hirundo rustica rustica TaxID=333673 RepID=A0A3M0KA90_HIRRU|nr:hypothetical protein DUI87_19414 [Hirundo rustica rustica]